MKIYAQDSYFAALFEVIGYDDECDIIILKDDDDKLYFFKPNQEDILGLYYFNYCIDTVIDAKDYKFDEIKDKIKRVKITEVCKGIK